jgi:hypothetical protein
LTQNPVSIREKHADVSMTLVIPRARIMVLRFVLRTGIPAPGKLRSYVPGPPRERSDIAAYWIQAFGVVLASRLFKQCIERYGSYGILSGMYFELTVRTGTIHGPGAPPMDAIVHQQLCSAQRSMNGARLKAADAIMLGGPVRNKFLYQ